MPEPCGSAQLQELSSDFSLIVYGSGVLLGVYCDDRTCRMQIKAKKCRRKQIKPQDTGLSTGGTT